MKKNLLLIIIFFASLTLKGQVFFSEDFALGIPGGWTNVDNSGNNVLWRTTTTGSLNTSTSVDTVLNPTGTSAANGYLIIDSDSAGQLVTQDAVLTTTAINCTGHSSVHLAFNEYFAQYLASTGTVAVSNDNITWVDVHSADAGLALNQGTPNPNAVEVDITATAANQPAVYIRFSYHGEWDYWWFVDDVQLLEPPAVDLSVTSIAKMNSEYTLIPYLQGTTLDLSSEVTNTGGGATTGGTALFEIYNGLNQVYSENINLPNFSPGATLTVSPVTPFIPTSSGSYKSKITLSIAGDGNSSNDMLESDPILLSDTVYARDDDNFAGTLGIGVGPGQDGIVGQNFRVNVTDILTSITFFLGDGFGAQPNGTPVFVTIHTQINNSSHPDSIPIAISETLLVTPGMIPSGGAYYTLGLMGGPLTLNPGLYFLGVHEVDSTLTLGYSNSIYMPGAVWVHWLSIPPPAVDGWAHAEDFTIEVAYMLRANFASNWDRLPELNGNAVLNVYPNPSSGIFYLSVNGFNNKSSLDVMVTDYLGQVVYTKSWNGMGTLAFQSSSLAKGIYYLQVRADEISASKKIIITD